MGPRAALEHGLPVVLDADDRPAVGDCLVERLLGPGGVRELALAVVMQDEQSQRWLVAVLGEVQHRDVAVGVTARQQRPAAGAAPDADRLLWAVVEVVGLWLVRDRSSAVVAGVRERRGAADHA